FRQVKLGNEDLKWEENTSTNVGLDLEFLRGRANFTLDVYQRSTDNLLFDPPNPATGGLTAPAIVNIGKMQNRGIDFALGYSGTFFGSFGNKIWDVQKEFYVFRLFNTNVRKDLLTDSWTPTHQNAKYPALDITDAFSVQPSTFYLENGSYVRLRNLQVGYALP